MSDNTQPKSLIPQGVTVGGVVVGDPVVQAQRLKVSVAASLKDLSKEYSFFIPALMYTQIRWFGQDPLADFIADYGSEATPMYMSFSYPLVAGVCFSGFEDVQKPFEHTLMAMTKDAFKAYEKWVGQIAARDADWNMLYRIRTQELDFPDVLALARATSLPDKIPTVPVLGLVLDTNVGSKFYARAKPWKPGEAPYYVYSTKRVNLDTGVFHAELTLDEDDPQPYAQIDVVEQTVTNKDPNETAVESLLLDEERAEFWRRWQEHLKKKVV